MSAMTEAMANGQESAFPGGVIDGLGNFLPCGLTKRELFAAMVMQGLLANEARCPRAEVEGGQKAYAQMAGRVAVEFADGLLAALEKTP